MRIQLSGPIRLQIELPLIVLMIRFEGNRLRSKNGRPNDDQGEKNLAGQSKSNNKLFWGKAGGGGYPPFL